MRVFAYKNMQAVRQISQKQRESIEVLKELFLALCLQLEKRMMQHGVFTKQFGISLNYRSDDGSNYTHEEKVRTSVPIQSGIEIMQILRNKLEHFTAVNNTEHFLNNKLTAMGVSVSEFVPEELVQYTLFENKIKENKLRKTVHSIKNKYGAESLKHAAELSDNPVLKDVIGFGSIKDLHDDMAFFDV